MSFSTIINIHTINLISVHYYINSKINIYVLYLYMYITALARVAIWFIG